MYLSPKDIFNFNIDELEIYGTFSNYKTLLTWINDSNSDFITFWEYTLKKSDNLRDYLFKIDFFKNNFPCFAFYIWKKLNTKITTRDYFKVYWSAFTIIELNEIIDFIETYIEYDSIDKKNWSKHNTIKRFDIAFDLSKNLKNDIIKNFSKLTEKWTKYYWAKWVLETYYIWEYQKRFNKNFIIRIYNKLEDIKKKGKQKLYPHYLIEKDITRIEIEFRNDVTKYVKLDQLRDRDYIFNLFIKYIEKHTKLFNKLKTKNVEKLKRLNKKVSIDDLKYDQILKQRYLSSFIWYWKTILNIWSCPTEILLLNLLVSEKTIQNINLWIDNNKFDINKYIKWISIKNSEFILSNSKDEDWSN